MRTSRCLLLAALLVSLVPPSAGQDLPLPPPVVVEDPVGDVQGAVPGQAAGFVDLVRGEVVPSMAGLDFRATVADLSADAASGFQVEFWLDLEYRNTVFHFVILGQTSAPVPEDVRRPVWGLPYAALYRMGGDGFPAPLIQVPAVLDPGARTWNATLPWSAIESEGSSPQPGEALRLREAATVWDATLTSSPHQGTPFVTGGITSGDVAPFPEGTFLSVPGAIGDLGLATPLPVRSSNGEATTFHWPVEVINRGGRDLDVAFELDAQGAEGRVPPGLHLPAGTTATVNVFVTVPFQHAHGTTRDFPLTARAGPGDMATLHLGVDYPVIAQPAGHHPDLYLHGADSHLFGVEQLPVSYGMWMNTLEEDPAGTAAMLNPGSDNCPLLADIPMPPPLPPLPAPGDLGSSWTIPLRPALAIGLDGRVGEAASLDVTLVASAAMPSGTLHGRLTRTSETFEIGPFYNQTDPYRGAAAVAAQPGPGPVDVHLDLPMPPSLDLVPPTRGEDLLLALVFCLDTPSPAGAGPAFFNTFAGLVGQSAYVLQPGGHLRLALDEYHDIIPVDHSVEGLFLTVDEPVARAAPGATVVFEPRLSFPANATAEHAVRLFGTGAAHAQLRAPAVVRGPDERTLPISFVVPEAMPGDVFDLLLEVTHVQDPTRSVALRLSVVVDPQSTRDDAGRLTDVEQGGKDAPSLPTGLAVVALALLALRRRRRDP